MSKGNSGDARGPTTWSPENPDSPVTTGEILEVGDFASRYLKEDEIASGGMGLVSRVRDRQMNRVLAMKILRPEFKKSAAAVARFVEEAQATAQLQHPGVVPVHDLGRLPDGRPYFTMREIRGRTLHDVMREVREGDETDWTVRRLVAAFHAVTVTVAYAHHRGVVHRDLKPQNIMVGEFGEVLVVDWGLAKVLGVDDPTGEIEPVATDRSADQSFLTKVGTVAGTPRYMAPEQWAGDVDTMGPHTDVYCLGCILAEIITGEVKPRDPGTAQMPELLRIALKARSEEPNDRHQDAEELAAEVEAWIDGALRAEEARQLVADARVPERAARVMLEQAAELQEQANKLADTIAATAPVEEKRALWDLQDRAEQFEREASLRQVEQVQLLRAALMRSPDLKEGRDRLSDFYLGRHQAAETARNARETARLEALLRAYDRGRHEAYLTGTGALTLHTDPPGADVSIHEFVDRDRRLILAPGRALGKTPLNAVELPMGSFVVVVEYPGRQAVHYPVKISRQHHWDGVAPGESEPTPIRLLETLPDTDAYIPAGWTWVGGDEEAIGALPRRRVWVDGFVLRKLPVSQGEFAEFLSDLAASGRVAEALERAAFDGREGGLYEREDHVFTPALYGPDYPATYVNWADAMAYADWEAGRGGLPWRLPGDIEWEKAARGVDARFFPWGDHLDPTFACFQSSHVRTPAPPTLDEYPLDVSPYGVRLLGGTVRDWCRCRYERYGHPVVNGRIGVDIELHDDNPPRVQRGGVWALDQRLVRSCTRWWQAPSVRSNITGIRLARPI